MRNLFHEVKAKWMRYSPDTWWGDSVDVRFHLIRELRKLQGQTILDIGCGPGIILSEAGATNRKYGLDMAVDALRTARALDNGAAWVAGSMYALPFNATCFDVVVMANVIEVPPNSAGRSNIVSEVRRVLRPGGWLLLTTPNRGHWAYQRASKLNYDDLSSLLTSDFEVTIRGYNPLPPFPFFLPPSLMSWVPRWAWRYLFIPSPLLALMPGIDALLRWLMGVKWLLKMSKAFYVEAGKA